MITPQFGGPDLFEERDVERPRPGPGEDLVRVVAAGTNPVYAKVRAAGGSRGLDTAGSDNQETLEQLGTDVPIDYTRQDTVEVALDNTGGTGVDAVFDTVGGETVVDSIPATRPFGRLATILGAQGDLMPC